MTLRTKFNIALLLLGGVGIGGIANVSRQMLLKNAREEVIQRAGIMMEAAQAIRKYTVDEIKPLLKDAMENDFLPQSVPAYAAMANFNRLREMNRDFVYKEAALNPTNPSNRAQDWESEVIQHFRANSEQKEFIGERDTVSGRSLYLSRPIVVKEEACLTCHGNFTDAPRPMLKRYGVDNGFGWKMQEVIGAQIVSVPMELPLKRADETFKTLITVVGGTFLIVVVVMNFLLSSLVMKPIARMSLMADKVSSGEMNVPEFTVSGKDELSTLGASFNRMRRSVEKALAMLDE